MDYDEDLAQRAHNLGMLPEDLYFLEQYDSDVYEDENEQEEAVRAYAIYRDAQPDDDDDDDDDDNVDESNESGDGGVYAGSPAYEDKDADADADDVFYSDIKLPFGRRRRAKKRLKTATRGVFATSAAVGQSTPLMEFFGDLAVVVQRNPRLQPERLELPEPLNTVPRQNRATLIVNVSGAPSWSYRDGVAYVFGVDPTGGPANPYNVPIGTTVTLYRMRAGQGPEKKYFFTRAARKLGYDSELRVPFGRKKRRGGADAPSLATRPFTLTATGIPGPDSSRMFVLPPEAVNRKGPFSVVFPLLDQQEGVSIDEATVRAGGGGALLIFGAQRLDAVAIVNLPPDFRRNDPLRGLRPPEDNPPPPPPPPQQQQQSGAELAAGTDTGEKDARRERAVERTKEIGGADADFSRRYGSALDDAQLEKWVSGPVAYLGTAMAHVLMDDALHAAISEGPRTMTDYGKALVSEVVRSGLAFLVANRGTYDAQVTPEKALSISSTLMQAAFMLRWMGFTVLSTPSAPWDETQKMTFSVPSDLADRDFRNILRFDSAYFVEAFPQTVETAQKSGALQMYLDAVRSFSRRLLEVTAMYGDMVAGVPGGETIMATALRNYVLMYAPIPTTYPWRRWLARLEPLIFVLIASGTAMAERAGIDGPEVGRLVRTMQQLPFELDSFSAIHDAVTQAAPDS